jgi:hypothetical protein
LLSISKEKERSVSFTIALKSSEIQKIKSLAHKQEISVSQLVRNLMFEAEKAA